MPVILENLAWCRVESTFLEVSFNFIVFIPHKLFKQNIGSISAKIYIYTVHPEKIFDSLNNNVKSAIKKLLVGENDL